MNEEIVNENLQKVAWVYDLECLSNFFSFYAIEANGDREVCFVIHESRNHITELISFLYYEVKSLIGFNNVNYDYPLLHALIMDIWKNYQNQLENAYLLTQQLYNHSQRIITAKHSAIYANQVLIPQIDLFKIHHFDNKNKRRSLKDVEFIIRVENVEDMPIHHSDQITDENIDFIINYNRNDVIATKKFFQVSMADIKLRINLKKKFGLDLMNANDPKIGTEILLNFICNRMNWDKELVKEARNNVNVIHIGDYIFDYITFNTKEFDNILTQYKNWTFTVGQKSTLPKFHKNFEGIPYHYGIGGIHACITSGVYDADDEYDIEDIDVAGFYPAVAVQNDVYPEHLGPAFGEIYKERYDYRISIKPDKTKKDEAGLWKLSLNGVSGNVDNQFNFLYDPTYAVKVKINGQLMVTMLIEDILLNCKNVKMLQANTDGFTIKIPKSEKPLMYELCKKWEEITKLELEFSNYRRMIIRDVNNYIGIYDKDPDQLTPYFEESVYYDNKYSIHKCKGAYQVIPEANGRIAYWKSWNSRIVQKAVHDYFVYNTPVRNTIINSNDIYDFYKAFKTSPGWSTIYNDHKGIEHKLSKTTRYYLSVNGGRLLKIHNQDSRKLLIEATGRVTVANKHINMSMQDYKIDYSYYIKEANKLIYAVFNNGQTILEF